MTDRSGIPTLRPRPRQTTPPRPLLHRREDCGVGIWLLVALGAVVIALAYGLAAGGCHEAIMRPSGAQEPRSAADRGAGRLQCRSSILRAPADAERGQR